MNQDLRDRIARTLAEAGLASCRDTTTKVRPQWRASFSFSGELHGEPSYVHIYVPADADQLQINCTAPSPALDPMPVERQKEELAQLNASHGPDSDGWARVIGELGASPADVQGWEVATRPYMGMQHRMMLARVTMPLESLSSNSVKLAVRLGLHLARGARESLAATWESSQEGK